MFLGKLGSHLFLFLASGTKMVYAINMIKLLLFLFLVIAPFFCFVYFAVSFIINMCCFPMQKSSIHAQFYLYHTLTHYCDSHNLLTASDARGEVVLNLPRS